MQNPLTVLAAAGAVLRQRLRARSRVRRARKRAKRRGGYIL